MSGVNRPLPSGVALGHVLQGGYNERPRRADSGFSGGGGFNFPGEGGFGEVAEKAVSRSKKCSMPLKDFWG